MAEPYREEPIRPRTGLEDLVGKGRLPRFILARRPPLSDHQWDNKRSNHQLCRRNSPMDRWKDRDQEG